MFENVRIYVTDMSITPFTVGLLKPKIVLPKVMVDSYSGEYLKTIVQHKQTHIRLGHLWFGLAWDILRCLIWVNPFLTVFQKQFRADLEDICDRMCIQSSGKPAHEIKELTLFDFLEAADGRTESLAEKKFALAGGWDAGLPHPDKRGTWRRHLLPGHKGIDISRFGVRVGLREDSG